MKSKLSRKYRAYQRGLWAERFAAIWLSCKGYQILARRLQTPVAEIDLLVRHRVYNRACLVIIEVKYRQDMHTALLSLDVKQQYRLQRAGLWLQSSGYMKEGDSLRWDFMALSARRFPCHIRNI